MRKEKLIKLIKLSLLCSAVALFIVSSSCKSDYEATVVSITGGDPQRGRRLIQTYGCGTCHTIPGVSGANGLVGPPLEGVGRRMYLAGRIQNSPQNMIHWIRFPRAVDPQTVMPQMNVTEQDGRDITAYLYLQR